MTTVAERQTMTAERFAQGKTWAQWVEGIQANKPKFLKNYEDFTPKPEEVAFFKAFAAKKGLQAVAIGEDWCPDVVRGMPVIARLWEAAGLDLAIFDRDKNMDLTNEFLWRHKFMCIPVIVLYDGAWNELGHWIEKPSSAYKWSAELRTQLKSEGVKEEEMLPIIRERRAAVEIDWMHETVQELREQVLWRVL
jgi:hypothetical protein